jgi:hypothetical protein
METDPSIYYLVGGVEVGDCSINIDTQCIKVKERQLCGAKL